MKVIPLINPKVMDLHDKYVYLSNELKNTEIMVECKDVWFKMNSSKYEKLLYNLICDAEKDIFSLNSEIDSLVKTMIRMGNNDPR